MSIQFRTGRRGQAKKTFKVQAQSIAYDHIVLRVVNDGALPYHTIRLFRNGLAAADYPGTTTSITDNGVVANANYEYKLEGRYNSWGSVSVTDSINLTTPPNPNTFDASVTARDARIIDVTIYDTLFNALVYGIYRDGQLIARTTGREFSDFDINPQTTHTYQVEALTASLLRLGLTGLKSVTTPQESVPSTPPPPPPPQNPTYPIRLVSGVTMISPAPPAVVLKDSCITVEFTFENVGTVSLDLDSIIAIADVDMIFQQVQRFFQRDQHQPPITIHPGDRFTYRGNNCSNVFPGVFAHAVVKPYFKVHTIAGDRLITDLDPGMGYLQFDVLESNTNPDLKVTALSMTPAELTAGSAASVSLVVSNQGDGLAATSNFRLTLDDGTIRTSTLPQINPGASTTTTFDLGIQAVGTFHPSYAIDPNNYIHEWNENNNTGSFYYTVSNLLPDLLPTGTLVAPANPDGNDHITITVDVRNSGQATSPATQAQLVFRDGIHSYVQPVPSLPPGQNSVLSFDIGVLSVAAHIYDVTVDSSNAVLESDEANNVMSNNFGVNEIPPLVLTLAKDLATNAVVLNWNDTDEAPYLVQRAAGPSAAAFSTSINATTSGVQYRHEGGLLAGANQFYLVTPGSPVTAFADDFNRLDSDSVGNGWSETTISPGDARIQGARLRFPTNDGAVAYRPYEGGAGGNDVTLTWVYRKGSDVPHSNEDDGVCLRYDLARSVGGCLALMIEPIINHRVSIWDGQVLSSVDYPMVLDTDYNFQWDVYSDYRMRVWIWRVGDPKPPAPQMSIAPFTPVVRQPYWAIGDRSGAQFDDFRVERPARP